MTGANPGPKPAAAVLVDGGAGVDIVGCGPGEGDLSPAKRPSKLGRGRYRARETDDD